MPPIASENHRPLGIPTEQLVGFYHRAYAAARPHTAATLVFPAYKRAWVDFEEASFPPAHFENVVVDAHLYQCFGDTWQKETSLDEALEYARARGGARPQPPLLFHGAPLIHR